MPGPGSAVVYLHGGGLIARSLDLYDWLLCWYLSETGVHLLSVDYRMAPDVKGTTLAQDASPG